MLLCKDILFYFCGGEKKCLDLLFGLVCVECLVLVLVGE